MSLLDTWRETAYSPTASKDDLRRLWKAYFEKEKEIYASLLSNPDEVVKGTVDELADKYDGELMTMVGFLDGINDSLKKPNPIEEMDENT
ncbi:MAG: SEC-C domain-containing protein, partial [Lachnospiraceae bacterium]|nr:SEC-C domain-containing protein [Lachnospiraceae bacterium]